MRRGSFARVLRDSCAACARTGAGHGVGTVGSGAGDAGGRCRWADGAGGDGSGECCSGGLVSGDSGPGGKARRAGTAFRPARPGEAGCGVSAGDGREARSGV
jgi:hypothetical protein